MAESCGAARSNTARGSMKKPLMGSVTFARSTRRAQPGGKVGHAGAGRIPLPGAAAAHVAAADHDIGAAGAEDLEHLGQQRLVVLEVPVHGGHVGGQAALHALDEG